MTLYYFEILLPGNRLDNPDQKTHFYAENYFEALMMVHEQIEFAAFRKGAVSLIPLV